MDSDRFTRFALMCLGVWAVDTNRVNLNDLCSGQPGRIIRCDGPPSDVCKYYPAQEEEALGCLAACEEE